MFFANPIFLDSQITVHSPDTSISIARRHLQDWEPEAVLPTELKEKIKRKRESFEKVFEEHSKKKKQDEELISNGKRHSFTT